MFIRNEYVVLRKEGFGGIAFHKKTGTTIELDKEGQYLLETLDQPKIIEDLMCEMANAFQKEYSECELAKLINSVYVIIGQKRVDCDIYESINYMEKTSHPEKKFCYFKRDQIII